MTLSYSQKCLWWLISLQIVTLEGIDGSYLNRNSDSYSDPVIIRNKREEESATSNLRLDVTFRDLPSEKGFLIGSSPSVVMDVMITNPGSIAEDPAIYVSWWRLELKYATPEDNCSFLSEDHHTVTYKCQTGQPLQYGESSSVSFEFDMSTMTISEQTIYEVMFNVTARTGSRPSVSESIMLPLYAQADLHIEGNSPNLDIFESETSSSSQVTFHHNFHIGLDGPSPLSNVIVVFELPVNLTRDSSGIAVTTVVNVRSFQKEGDLQLTCHVSKGHFSKSKSNHPDIKHSSMDDAEGEDPDFEVTGMGGQDEDNPMDKYLAKMTKFSLVKDDKLVISCNSPSISCIEMTCRIANYRPGAVVSVSFVMDVEPASVQGLMETYNVSAIQIESKAKVTLPYIVNEVDVQSLTNKSDEAKAITTIYRKEKLSKSKLSYILAGVIGLTVVLALFALSFYAYYYLKKLRSRRDSVVDAAEMNPLKMNDMPTSNQTDFRI